MTGGDRHHGRARVRRLAAARIVSAGGSQAAQVALVYQVYATTHSGAWVVASLFASLSVGGLLGPLSGWVADHFNRRSVMVASELGGGAAYLVLVAVHGPGLLVAGALAATILGAPFRAASAAAIPNLVDVEELPWANGLLGTAFNVALVAGPFAGGALVAASGARLVFAVNAASFLVSAAVIAVTPGNFGGRSAEQAISETQAVLAGFHLLLRDRVLAPLAASSALAFGAFGSALVIDPALAHAFHAGAVGYGLLTTVWGGGAVLGAIVAGRTVQVSWAPRAIVWGMLAMAVSLGSIVVLPSFALIVAAGTFGGVGNGFVFIPWLLVIQHRTPDGVRGRAIAATEALDQMAFLSGMGVAVPTVSLLGAHHAYGVTAVLLAGATIAATRALLTAERSVVAQALST